MTEQHSQGGDSPMPLKPRNTATNEGLDGVIAAGCRMTFTAQQAFGALRQSDHHELQAWEIAIAARLSKGQTVAAVRDLCRLGLLVRRREGAAVFFRVNHRAMGA